ncbi:unnamed protein product [Discosporangium mesarthrocarpum]
MNSVVGSHDIHVGKLLAREDETRAAESKDMLDIVSSRATEERARNRSRVVELRDFLELNHRQIGELISSKLVDDDDDPEGL